MKMNANWDDIQVLCFDFDGTVADTMPFLTEIAVKLICHYYNVDEMFAREQYVKTTGLPFEQQIQSIFPENPNNGNVVREFEEEKKRKYLAFKPIQHVNEVLKALQEQGYLIAISSSTLQPLVSEYIKTYQLPCDLALGFKPNFRKGKDHFESMLQTFRMQPENLCYIGDSLNDYRLAAMNQIRFVGKIGLFQAEAFYHLDPAMTVINQMDELLSIFNGKAFCSRQDAKTLRIL
jgi:phosphoglycolate phosphatase-like HAD superfamily hydrolase